MSLAGSMLRGRTPTPHLPILLLRTCRQLLAPGPVSTDPILLVMARSPSHCLGTSRSHPAGEQMGRGHAGHHPQSVLGGAGR